MAKSTANGLVAPVWTATFPLDVSAPGREYNNPSLPAKVRKSYHQGGVSGSSSPGCIASEDLGGSG